MDGVVSRGDGIILTCLLASYLVFVFRASSGEPAQVVAFSAGIVRLVKFKINSAHSGFANDYVGLSEVVFIGADPLEVPSLGLLGQGLLIALLGSLASLAVWRRGNA